MIKVSPVALNMAIDAVKHAMAKKDVRYYLLGVYFKFDAANEQLILEATDGHRLTKVKIAVVERSTYEDWEVIVSSDSIPVLAAQLKAMKSQALVELDETILGATLIDGKFPDTNRMWNNLNPAPSEFTSSLLDTRYLSEAVTGMGKLVKHSSTGRSAVEVTPNLSARFYLVTPHGKFINANIVEAKALIGQMRLL